jgi:hypothetical protein
MLGQKLRSIVLMLDMKSLETTYDDAIGFMCNTQVTIEGETLAMWLPVMDSKNQVNEKA